MDRHEAETLKTFQVFMQAQEDDLQKLDDTLSKDNNLTASKDKDQGNDAKVNEKFFNQKGQPSLPKGSASCKAEGNLNDLKARLDGEENGNSIGGGDNGQDQGENLQCHANDASASNRLQTMALDVMNKITSGDLKHSHYVSKETLVDLIAKHGGGDINKEPISEGCDPDFWEQLKLQSMAEKARKNEERKAVRAERARRRRQLAKLLQPKRENLVSEAEQCTICLHSYPTKVMVSACLKRHEEELNLDVGVRCPLCHADISSKRLVTKHFSTGTWLIKACLIYVIIF